MFLTVFLFQATSTSLFLVLLQVKILWMPPKDRNINITFLAYQLEMERNAKGRICFMTSNRCVDTCQAVLIMILVNAVLVKGLLMVIANLETPFLVEMKSNTTIGELMSELRISVPSC